MKAQNPHRAPAALAASPAGTSEKTPHTTPARQQVFILVLRALMEAGIVAGFAWWGYRAGAGTGMKILLAVGAPALGFGFWGVVDFHQAGRLAEPLRLLQELAISALAAVAVYATGQHFLGWALGLLSVAYHALVYLQGGRLLKHRPSPRARTTPAPGAPVAPAWPEPGRAGQGEPASATGGDAS
jgi:Protein of unknown function (DUF2568)